jgi:hypothetical protein
LGAEGTQLGEAERFVLGSMVVEQIRLAADAGAIKDPPFMLYIDETENFVHMPIDTMLARVRQFGLGMVLANQYLAQLTGDAQDAVEGNVGTMFSFEIGQTDARHMRHYMTTFTDEELTSLGLHRAAVSMRHQGIRHPAFTMETMPPPGEEEPELPEESGSESPPSDPLPPPGTPERERYIRKRSVENYTPKTYDEVMAWLRGDKGNGGSDPDDTDEPPEEGDQPPDYYEK